MSVRAPRSKLLKSALCLLLVASGAAQAQTQPAEPPRLKRDFGSSLKRLKWDAEQKRAVEAAPKGTRSSRGEDEEDEVVRVETSLVVCDVLVLDEKGYAVRGLGRDDFIVTEDGRAQETGTFALGDNANVPRTIVLIIDYSGSMAPFLDNSIEAAKTLVEQLNPRDTMAIVTDDVEMVAGFTRDKAALKAALDALTRKVERKDQHNGRHGRYGSSRQYSALMATLRELFDEEDVRPIVIFQTDGDEAAFLRKSNVPRFAPTLPPDAPPRMREAAQRAQRRAAEENETDFGLEDVYAAAERSRATVYSVIPGVRFVGLVPGEEQTKANEFLKQYDRTFPPSPVPGYGTLMRYDLINYWLKQGPVMQLNLVELSKLSGGWTEFLEEPEQAAGVYGRILSDINRRYVVGFYPTNKERDGKRRRVKIEVRGHPEYTVWGRKSYYAPGP